MEKFNQPMKLTGSERALSLMPTYKELPDDFTRSRTKWNKAVSKWFFEGIKRSDFTAKDGIDVNDAFRHLGTVMNSWEPAHEHKEAGVAYLMSLWFSDVTL